MLPLSSAAPGTRVEIVEIRAGRGLTMRLANMGFFPGTVISVISSVGRGPLIIARDGVRLGLGFGMAHKIWVRVPDVR